MSEKKDHKVQIWVALIGFVGVLGAAVIGNWDKITTESPKKSISKDIKTNKVSKSSLDWKFLGEKYNEKGFDQKIYRSLPTSTYIKSKKEKTKEVIGDDTRFTRGVLSRTVDASNFLNSRIKISSYMRTQDLSDRSVFYVETMKGKKLTSSAYCNIQETTEWHNCFVVIDIPLDTTSINYGVVLLGQGQVWFDDIAMKKVPKNTSLKGVLP